MLKIPGNTFPEKNRLLQNKIEDASLDLKEFSTLHLRLLPIHCTQYNEEIHPSIVYISFADTSFS
jgi:hypothetical protein